MKISTKRIVSLVLALCLLLTMLPVVATHVDAASNIVIDGVDIGYASGGYFTKNGSSCKSSYFSNGRCHKNGVCDAATSAYCNCMRYWPTGVPGTAQIDLLASQCFGFARYCQWRVFGYHDGNSSSKFKDLTGRINSSGCTSNNLKSKLINCAPATHIRTGDGGHSIVIISATDYGVNLADCNSDGYCKIRNWTYSWSEFASYLSGRSGIQYAKSATAGSSHSTHTYTGDYHEAAHPHKVYQKCSCGATQYTGATKTVSSCESCNPVSTTSKYSAVLPFKAYLKGTTDIVPYKTKQLTDPSGEIWATDECTITAVYSNGACEVKYPVGSGTNIAYTNLSNFVGNTGAALTRQTVNREIKTYIRSSTGSTQYGHTDPGDTIYKLGTSGSMTQIFYPTSSGFKLAWVVTSELTEPTYDNRFNPYCPIKGYPCATENFDVYESDHTTYKGKIFTTDYCTINAVYADGWCNVTYPTSSGNKTGYAPLSKFVYNVNATHVKYTANAQIKVHKNSSLPGDLNWYISSGDQFFAVGSSGSSTQVLYPIDAQYGGGYKLGWISTSNLPKTTYTVSYNANGGSGAPGSQTKTHGVALTLSSTKPTRSGYTFVGWATSASATSAAYAPGASYTNDANLTLYAVWKLNKYEISYNANGGTGAPAAQSKTHGTNLTLSSTVPAKYYTVTFNANGGSVDVSSRQVACKFLGWATSSTATSAAYQPGGTFTTNANTTLYAVWQNSALGAYPIPVRSGYVFDGWYTAASGGSQVTVNTVISGNTTIYAHWTVATYGVNYDANGGIGAPESQVKTHGKNLTLSTTVPTREGYFFCGWGTEEAPNSVQYQPGSTYSADSDIMLIAVWEEIALESIVVVTKPNKTVYYVGDALDETGLTLRATYNDGSTKTVTNGFVCSPYLLENAGTQTITVSYGLKLTSFTVEVKPVELSSISIAAMPNKTGYYVGDTLDTTGLVLTATYNNGSTKTITSGYSCTPTTLNTAGTQTITVSYGGKSTTFTVSVTPVSLTGIAVASKPTKTSYYVGDTLDTTGLVLTATYNDGSTKTITSGYSCTPTTLNTAGIQQITVTYGGKTATFSVTVDRLPAGALTVGTASGNPGDTIQIPIVLEPNPGLIAARLKITYDASAMTLVQVCDGGILGEHVFGADLSANPYIVMWENGLVSSNFTGTGTLVTLSFRVNENASEGTYPVAVSYDPEEVYDVNMVNVDLSVTQGSVTVEIPQGIASGTCGNDLRWTLDGRGILTVTGSGKMRDYTYKSEMPWYAYRDQIKTVVLESGVTSIGDYAFYGMPALRTIEIPATVTSIGDYAFKNCPVLDGVELPANLTKLGESAFYACTGLTTIEIPVKLYTVKPYTFKNCTALAEVTFNEGNLQKISDGAFYNTALTELTLPDCLDILDVYAFKNCAKLRKIDLGSGLTEIREAVFYGSAIPGITIPEGITKIGPYAFKNCTRLISIDLPESLTSVGEASFYACTALESLELPDAVTKIGNYAFRKCAALMDVAFGSGLTDIGESSFYGCEGLIYLDIPENVTTIQGYAFKGCTDLEIVELPESLKTLGDSAFHTCTSLSEIIIPGSVTKVGEYCFSGSVGIDYITFKGNAPTIGTGAFNKIIATAYYPSGNATWTSSVRQNYGGTLTWRAQ